MGQETDERALVERVRGGDREALTRLFDGHAGILHALAYRILGNAVEAEEIVIAVFQRLWGQPDASPDAAGSVTGSLIAATRRRSLRRLQEILEAGEPSDGSSIATVADALPGHATERQQVIAAALRNLSAEHRQIIDMAYFQGLTPVEIATVLRRSLPFVTASLAAAMAHLETLAAHLWGDAG